MYNGVNIDKTLKKTFISNLIEWLEQEASRPSITFNEVCAFKKVIEKIKKDL